jgi:2-amino-4-hydroxy-6-hydroxymethyldihydropteridine diphosphokinase
MSEIELGDLWLENFYSAIRDSLGLNEEADVESRNILCSLLDGVDDLKLLNDLALRIQDRTTIVFGAGPSLEADIGGLCDYIFRTHPVIVAADGACDALGESEISTNILVSDLDSCSVEALKLCSRRGCVFAHAHGDNIDLVRTIVPQFSSSKLGTTQVKPRLPVRNFGGFTDGDRACYIVSFFKPKRVVIAGMGFGRVEGKYSLSRYGTNTGVRRELKLEWGRRSLEFLISKSPKIQFVNVTENGADIKGALKMDYSNLS